MKNTLFTLVALAAYAAVCVVAGDMAATATGVVLVPATHIGASSLRPHADDTPADAQQVAIAAYVASVIEKWPSAAVPDVDRGQLAWDIAGAAIRRASPAPDEDAILLAALAFFEGSRFARYVDDGACNDPRWRRDGLEEGEHVVRGETVPVWASEDLLHVGGDCDGGRAYSLWQVHPIEDTSSPLYAICRRQVITASRQDAAYCALEIARADPSLCTYAGYGPFAVDCPKGAERLAFARKAIAEHPFRPGGELAMLP